MSRPITNSVQIVEALDKLNAQLGEVISALPNRPKELSDEEKAVFIKNGVPIPESVPVEDPVLKELSDFERSFKMFREYIVDYNTAASNRRNEISARIDRIDTKLSGISWAMVFMLTFMCIFCILNFKGCDTKREINPPDNTAVVTLEMDQWHYDIVKSAVTSVIQDIDTYDDLGEAFKALYSEMPRTVRDQVMDVCKKKVSSLETMPDQLRKIVNEITIIQ